MPRSLTLILLVAAFVSGAFAEHKRAETGTVILGGGFTDSDQLDLLIQRMIQQAGTKPNVILIPTADPRLEPALRPAVAVNPIDYENDARPDFVSLGAGRVRVLHTRNHLIADTAAFVDPLRYASLVWIPSGNPELLFSVYPHTRVERELKGVLERGGVVAGDSAGAMLLGQARFSLDIDHPEQVSAAPELALDLVPGVFVVPHANQYKPGVIETAARTQVRARPELLGLLLEENTAVIIHDEQVVGIVGKGRVGIVESPATVRWLAPHERYDLRKRALIAPVMTDAAKAQ